MTLKTSLRPAPRQALRIGPALRQAIGFLEMSNAELARALRRELAGLPGVTLDGAEALLPAAGESLTEHARAEARLILRGAQALALADRFVAALEPTGWLGRPPEAIAAEAGVPVAEAQAVLERLRQMEPAGLFAISLADCLRLQAADQGRLTPVLAAVLDHLPALEDGLPTLADACGISQEEARTALDVLRGFDPKPGARFDPPVAGLGRPHDLVAELTANGVRVAFNPDSLPRLALDGAAPQRARRLAAMLERRNALVLAIATAAANRQREWLVGERDAPATLHQKDVAVAANVHESTVSRIAAALSMHTPQGVLPLQALFARHGTLRDAITRAIDAEDPACPLSDAALTRLLRAQGHAVARRSVARHRHALGHPHASRRAARV